MRRAVDHKMCRFPLFLRFFGLRTHANFYHKARVETLKQSVAARHSVMLRLICETIAISLLGFKTTKQSI